LGDQGIETLAVCGAGRGEAEVVVNDGDRLVGPAQLMGTFVERVLQPQALLMAQHLMRG
jgi:hypothetical protein